MRVEARLVGGHEVASRLKRAPQRLMSEWQREMSAALDWGAGRMQREYRSATRTTAKATAVGTGNLRASYGAQVRKTGQTLLVGEVGVLRMSARGNALVYAAVHESDRPTTIKAKRGWLAIPLKAAKSKSGLAPSPREFPDLFLIKKWMILARQVGGPNGPIIPMYKLKRSVTIPGRPAINPVGPRIIKRLVGEMSATFARTAA